MTMTDWIRPWYPGAAGDHVRANCPTLAAETDNPREGAGWLNPGGGDGLCEACFSWDVTCHCGASLTREEGSGPHDKSRAEEWMKDHFCLPSFRYLPTPRPPAAADAPTAGQLALFDLKDIA